MAPRWAHIITVGASLANNCLRELNWNSEELKKKLSEKPEEVKQTFLEKVKADPKGKSAELNTCLDLLEEGHWRGRTQKVYLFHSDTPEGELCASVLAEYLNSISKDKFSGRLTVETVRIEKLGDQERFSEGLANLLDCFLKTIKSEKEKGATVLVHATGGYKPETAIAVLASNLPGMGAPVFYIHEGFRKRVRIPAFPVRPRQIRTFATFMDEMCRVKEMSLERAKKFRRFQEAERMGWVETDEERERVRVTEMGGLIWEKLRRYYGYDIRPKHSRRSD